MGSRLKKETGNSYSYSPHAGDDTEGERALSERHCVLLVSEMLNVEEELTGIREDDDATREHARSPNLHSISPTFFLLWGV